MTPTDDELYDLAAQFHGDPVPAMRRALEQWGNQSPPRPIPLSEQDSVPADLLDEWITKAGSDWRRIVDMAAKWGHERGRNEASEIAKKTKRDASRRCEADSQTVPERPRWTFSEALDRMVPLLGGIHVIPISDAHLHCADVKCWCDPAVELQPSGTKLYSHNAQTNRPECWVLIGEMPANALPLPEGQADG